MRVLVTGATGFIGRWILPALVSRNHEVVALSSRSLPQCKHEEVRWVQADLLNAHCALPIIESVQADALVHCAWNTTPGSYWTATDNLLWVAASLQLVEAFYRAGGRRVVVAGTSAEYCWDGVEDLSESTSAVSPKTLYGVCKDSLRRIIQQWAAVNDASWAWARVFCPFGIGEHPQRLIPRLITHLQSGANLPFDSGDLVRDFLAVQDLGDAFAALVESPVQGPINLASGRGLSIRELVTLIATCLKRIDQVAFDILPDPKREPGRIVARIDRLERDLNWKPMIGLEQRLLETCHWYAEHRPLERQANR